MGANPRTIQFWEPIIEKIERRLGGWKRAFLSRGGRLTLIQLVVSSLPIYFRYLFKIPTLVANRIEKLMRGFLWEGYEEGGGSHLVRWNLVTRSKEKGGLGIGNLEKKNRALLGK